MILSQIHRWARLQPDKTAVIHDGVPVGYADFWRAIKLVRRFLRAANIPAGKTAIVMIDDLFLAWLTVLALHWLGVNTVAALNLDVVAGLDLKNADCVVVAPVKHSGWNLAYAAVLGVRVVTLTPFGEDEVRRLDVAQRWDRARVPGSHILYTSGTTGKYKKLLLDAGHEDNRNKRRAAAMGFTARTVFHGFNYGIWSGAGFKQPMAAWHVGGCVVFDLRPNALDEFFELGITKASLLPPMCKEFLTAGARRRPAIDCSGLELNVMSGFLSLDVAQQIVRAITPRLYITYSATELVQVPMQSHFRAQEDLDWLAVSDGSTVEVVDDHNAPCPVGSEGYVRIRLADVDCKGYFENADATARSFRRGWFYSGDMAVRREDGRVRILGRVADVINLHGQKIMVAPIEQSLQRRLAAEEVCLFVHLNERGQEELLVAVQSPHPLEPAKIEMIHNQFSDFDSVKIQVLAEFPRTTTGTLKVRRTALKNQIKGTA